MSLSGFLVRGATLGATACSVIILSSCSDPVPTPAQGAFTAEFGNAPGNTCPATSPSSVVSAGSVTETDKAAVVDGDGASVNCKVVPAAGGIVAEGGISAGSVNFAMTGVTIVGTTGTGRVSLRGPNTVGTYTPSVGSTCNFELISADAGRIWARFECPTMERTGSPNSLCAVSDGLVVFENCMTE